ncbi:hypothetical protein VE03_10599, partial [Pseudogymnoascus sp. 23342-1-I1]
MTGRDMMRDMNVLNGVPADACFHPFNIVADDPMLAGQQTNPNASSIKRTEDLRGSTADFKEPSKNWEKDAEIVGISLADKQWQFDLQWPNGDITLAHPLKDVRVRCPQKLIELFVTNA